MSPKTSEFLNMLAATTARQNRALQLQKAREEGEKSLKR